MVLREIIITFKDEENTWVSWSKDHFVREKMKYSSKLFKIQISIYLCEYLISQQNRIWKIANLSTAHIVILYEFYYRQKIYTNCSFFLEKLLCWYLQDNHNEFLGEGVEIEMKVAPNRPVNFLLLDNWLPRNSVFIMSHFFCQFSLGERNP